jgi:AI-2 transport protein TqsA
MTRPVAAGPESGDRHSKVGSEPIDAAALDPAPIPPPRGADATAASEAGTQAAARPSGLGERPGLPRAFVMLVGCAAAFLVLGGIYLTAWLVGPLFLALMIVIAISPVQSALLRRGWPGWLTTLVLVVLVVGLLLLFAVVIIVSIARLAALLPTYSDQASSLMTSLSKSLEKFGVEPGQLQKAVSSIDPAKLVALIGALLAGLSGLVSSLVFLLCLLLFLSVESSGMDQRLAAVAGERPGLERALRSFAQGTRTYLVVTAVFGLIVGVLDAGALAIMGIPLPVLWGLLSFLTNFIPNIGFLIGLVPPALLALLDGGAKEMLLVVAVYCVLNLVIQSLIQPRFVGDSVGLAMTTTFLALIFWAWLLGPLGALLAIPLTLLVKALLVDVDPTARWAVALAGSLDRTPSASPARGGAGADTATAPAVP